MRAVVQQGYGGTETWTVREVPEPVPGRGEVLVEVRAAAIDRGTWHLMTGRAAADAALPRLPRAPRSRCPAATWPAWSSPSAATSTGFAVGDEVYGSAPSGSLAERAVV